MLIATIVCALAVGALLAAERAESRAGKAVAKLTASTAFVCVALLAGALESTYGGILLAGLCLCWLGDAFLLSSGRSTGFQLGIASFLLGHLAFAVAFLVAGVDGAGLVAAAVVVTGLAAWVLRWLAPHVPEDFRIAVRSYVLVISAMVALSVAAVAAGASPIVALGAVGFAVSDVSVARDRFVSPGFVNGAWGLPLYFGSQLLLAYSVGAFAASTA